MPDAAEAIQRSPKRASGSNEGLHLYHRNRRRPFAASGFYRPNLPESPDAWALHAKHPQGLVMGNIVVRADGTHDPLDWHSDHRFEQRAMNFIVGGAAVVLSTTAEVELGRRSTLPILAQIKGRPGASRVIEAMGRMSRLNDAQVKELLNWFGRIRNAAAEASS